MIGPVDGTMMVQIVMPIMAAMGPVPYVDRAGQRDGHPGLVIAARTLADTVLVEAIRSCISSINSLILRAIGRSKHLTQTPP